MKVALIHDFLLYWGGAERVLQGLQNIFPQAPIYTLVYNKRFTRAFFPKGDIRASFLQKVPLGHRWLLPFLPTAAESFNLDEYELVISSGTFSKGIITKPATLHVHYCHTPPRFLWEEQKEYIAQNVPFGLRSVASFFLHWLRIWDRLASQRVDEFVANSQWTASRIKKIYGREAQVIYPFVENPKFQAPNLRPEISSQIQNSKFKILNSYFLIVSRLQRYKHIELAIHVFNKLRLPLYIVGEGSDRKRLERMAGKNVKFVGFIPEANLRNLYRNARAVILPGQEDFGLTLIEAMNQGTPVFGYKKGGACETIVEGKTGEFFDEQNEQSFLKGLQKLLKNSSRYKKSEIIKHANKFSFERFRREILDTINNQISNAKVKATA